MEQMLPEQSDCKEMDAFGHTAIDLFIFKHPPVANEDK